jgi:hypothetical protein
LIELGAYAIIAAVEVGVRGEQTDRFQSRQTYHMGGDKMLPNKMLPNNPEGYGLCMYQGIVPTAILLALGTLISQYFSADETLKHLASGSTVLIAFGLLISVYTVLLNRARVSELASIIKPGTQGVTLLQSWERELVNVLSLAVFLLVVYFVAFFSVLRLLNESTVHSIIVSGSEAAIPRGIRIEVMKAAGILFPTMALALFGSLWLTGRTYKAYDACFGT